ncbi:TPA: hypothetical protein ACGH2N_004173 [Salmonella enterica subsp. enterica serovar Agona]|uniref:hypothetical protein n=1 Tax=Klebsiella aerogenes TaxID=548 RepID=UPI0036FBEF34
MMNNNLIVIGKTGNPRKTKISDIKIEPAQERIINVEYPGEEIKISALDAIARTFRQPPRVVYVTQQFPAWAYKYRLKVSNPAFEYWGEKLKKGERLPRGKFFKAYSYFKNY